MKFYYRYVLYMTVMLALSSQSYAQESCLIEPANDSIFTEDSGELLYIISPETIEPMMHNGELWRVNSLVRENNSQYRSITISPDGLRLAWIELVVSGRVPQQSNMIVYDISSGNETTISLFADLNVLPLTLVWIDNSTILSVYVPNTNNIGTDYNPFSLINVETLEIRYVFPPDTFVSQTENSEFEPTSLLSYSNGGFHTYPQFSPNGRFVLDYRNGHILYDIYNRQVIE